MSDIKVMSVAKKLHYVKQKNTFHISAVFCNSLALLARHKKLPRHEKFVFSALHKIAMNLILKKYIAFYASDQFSLQIKLQS